MTQGLLSWQGPPDLLGWFLGEKVMAVTKQRCRNFLT